MRSATCRPRAPTASGHRTKRRVTPTRWCPRRAGAPRRSPRAPKPIATRRWPKPRAPRRAFSRSTTNTRRRRTSPDNACIWRPWSGCSGVPIKSSWTREAASFLICRSISSRGGRRRRRRREAADETQSCRRSHRRLDHRGADRGLRHAVHGLPDPSGAGGAAGQPAARHHRAGTSRQGSDFRQRHQHRQTHSRPGKPGAGGHRLGPEAAGRRRIRALSDQQRVEVLSDHRNGRSRELAALDLAHSALRRVLGEATLTQVVRDQREHLMARVREQLDNEAQGYGIAVVDVRIRRADLPEQNSQAVYQRMQTERQQEAAQYRAEGAQKAQEIRAKADRDVTVLLAEAQSKGERTRGEGDAERNRIFADAYGRDPDFFSFYRSMQAYEAGLRANDTRMLLKPDSEFFRYFVDPSGKSREGGAQPGNTPPAR